jgi:hypothetical protein
MTPSAVDASAAAGWGVMARPLSLALEQPPTVRLAAASATTNGRDRIVEFRTA